MKPIGNARQINVNAVNALKRKTAPCAPNSSPTRIKGKKPAGSPWAAKPDR
jgi:hypothetical protein